MNKTDLTTGSVRLYFVQRGFVLNLNASVLKSNPPTFPSSQFSLASCSFPLVSKFS